MVALKGDGVYSTGVVKDCSGGIVGFDGDNEDIFELAIKKIVRCFATSPAIILGVMVFTKSALEEDNPVTGLEAEPLLEK